MSTDIWSFDISGDRHMEKAIAVAMSPLFGDKRVELWGYSLMTLTDPCQLIFHEKPYVSINPGLIIPFPAPLTGFVDIQSMITSWLQTIDWSEEGHYQDVIYKKGWRITNKSLPTEGNALFSVEPHWTEYHK